MKPLRNESGFTLVEALTTVAVLSILTLGIAEFYATFVRASQKTKALNSINQRLSLTAHRIQTHLRTAARNQSTRGIDPYEFVAVDGDNQGFINADTRPHNAIADLPNNRSDRVHFHGFESYGRLSSDTSTGRTYIAFWINGEDSPKTYDALQNTWGVLMRKRYHDNDLLLPTYPPNASPPQLSPLVDLNQNDSNHAVVNVLGSNIDYLSMQYYDPVTGDWRDNWNTMDSSEFPSDRRMPSAVKVALRAYDDRADYSSSASSVTVPPRWTQFTVSLTGGR